MSKSTDLTPLALMQFWPICHHCSTETFTVQYTLEGCIDDKRQFKMAKERHKRLLTPLF